MQGRRTGRAKRSGGVGTGRPQSNASNGPQVVSPLWLLRTGALMLLLALICGYGALCLLFYQGQWQFVLRPVRTFTHPATIGGAAVDVVRFHADASGLPQLSVWHISSATGGRYSRLTVLFLPAGDGSLADSTATLEALHALGITVWAIDYRGFGESAPIHPNEQAMYADAEAAWSYLVTERHLPPETVVPYGAGVGAALALRLATAHPRTPAVVLDDPRFRIADSLRSDPRVRMLPVRWLLHDRFDLQPALRTSTIPKLILSRGLREDSEAFAAADPKITVALPPGDTPAYRRELTRFFDLYASLSLR